MARRKQVLDVQVTLSRAVITDPEQAADALRRWCCSMHMSFALLERLEEREARAARLVDGGGLAVVMPLA